MSYYVLRVYGITCDRGTCTKGEEHLPHGGGSGGLREVRALMRENGWSYKDGKDYCPNHSRAHEEH